MSTEVVFAPTPPWDGLHPLVVHFPIVILLAPPLLILAGLLIYRYARPLWLTALGLMLVGTLAVFAAALTGTTVQDSAALRFPAAESAIVQHGQMAQLVVILFSLLTIVLAGLLLAAGMLPQPGAAPRRVASRGLMTALQIGFLLLYAGGTLALTHTAHEGGRLVHEFGIHAPIGEMPPAIAQRLHP